MNDKKSNEHKRMKSVVQGSTEIKNKSTLGKVVSEFLPDDLRTIRDRIWQDTIKPNIKRGLLEGFAILLYGTSDSIKNSNQRSNIIYSAGSSIYHNIQQKTNSKTSTEQNKKEYQTILYDSKGDAEIVLDSMVEAIDTYGSVSVSDYYDLSGHPELSEFTDTRFGWRSLASAKVIPVDGLRWRIVFSNVIPLY